MKTILRNVPGVLALLCILNCHAQSGFTQRPQTEAAESVERIMTTVLSRCHSTVNGVKAITFVPATNNEVAEVRALGEKAVPRLALYLDLKRKDGLTQLFAVKFLEAIGGSSTLGPLKRAFAPDQWEATRAAALNGMFAVSPVDAEPYVEAALKDSSASVRQQAQHLWRSYQRDSN